jgi:hypothetical protein
MKNICNRNIGIENIEFCDRDGYRSFTLVFSLTDSYSCSDGNRSRLDISYFCPDFSKLGYFFSQET